MRLRTAVNTTEKAMHRLSRGLRYISMGTLFIMVFFVTAGVIARYIFGKAINGDLEIQELMMVLIIFLAMAYGQLEKGNIQVELLIGRLKGRSKAILQSITYLLGLGILALIIWQMGTRAIHGLTTSGGGATIMLLIPKSPFVLIATIGLALMCVEWIIDLVHSVIQARTK
jgi:TRAP-type C4-dicarboxylate transport system permease small subunit